MMSMSTIETSVELQCFYCLEAGCGRQNLHTAAFKQAAQRENISRVIVDQQNLAAKKIVVGAMQPRQELLLLFRQFRDDAMQK